MFSISAIPMKGLGTFWPEITITTEIRPLKLNTAKIAADGKPKNLFSHLWNFGILEILFFRIFPDYFYPIKYELNNSIRVEIFVIDTVQLCGNTVEGQYGSLMTYMLWGAPRRPPQGPDDPDKAEEQWRWLENNLRKSKSDFFWTFLSSRKNGILEPIISSWPVIIPFGRSPSTVRPDAWSGASVLCFNGTESMHISVGTNIICKYDQKTKNFSNLETKFLQHLNETGSNGWRVDYVLSGAGAYEDNSNKHKKKVPVGVSTFFYPTSNWDDFIGQVGFGRGGFVFADVGPEFAEFRYGLGDMRDVHSFKTYRRPPPDVRMGKIDL